MISAIPRFIHDTKPLKYPAYSNTHDWFEPRGGCPTANEKKSVKRLRTNEITSPLISSLESEEVQCET